MTQTTTDRVLVTGAGSYIGLHIVRMLLDQGYRVRGTLRDLAREGHLREVLARHTPHGDRLELYQADLLADEGWDGAMDGIPAVLHVASPFFVSVPRARENELITPAVEGTLRVLRAAERAGVRRVVQTSSIVAVGGYTRENGRIFTEQDWTPITPETDPYVKSKTLAEKAAWDFTRSLPAERGFELATINPGYVLGPVLDERFTGVSSVAVRGLLKREYPGNPNSVFNIVDVRDVAEGHLAAMTTPEAAGERFLCVAGEIWIAEIAEILNRNFAARGYPVNTRVLPDLAVRLVALFDKEVRSVKDTLGKCNYYDNSKIRRVLGWSPRPMDQTIIEMAESMIQLKMV